MGLRLWNDWQSVSDRGWKVSACGTKGMKHLWQAAMEALENGIRENDLFFDVTDTSSPYGEATVKNAYNPYGPSEGRIAVNPYYSYEAIFSPVIKPGRIPRLTQFLCDLLLHHLWEIDAFSGMSRDAFQVRFLEQDILQGAFGVELPLEDFTAEEIRSIAYFYLRLCRTGNQERCFCDVMRSLYRNAWVNVREEGSVVLIVNHPPSSADERRVDAMRSIFLQAGRTCRIFWDIPPGIIECGETTIGNFVLF